MLSPEHHGGVRFGRHSDDLFNMSPELAYTVVSFKGGRCCEYASSIYAGS